jgi:hypothetical protein
MKNIKNNMINYNILNLNILKNPNITSKLKIISKNTKNKIILP